MSSTTDQGPTPEPTVPVHEVLNEAAGGLIDSSRISKLSDPTRDQVREFQISWESLPLETRRAIVREMIHLGDGDLELDFSRLLRALVQDEDAETRALAVRGLWEDDTSSFLVVLCEMARTDTDATVQETVAEALGQFCYLAELDELTADERESVRQALLGLMSNGANWMVRRRALESASYMSSDEQIKGAIAEAARSDFEQERAGALIAMGRTLDERWLPTVLAELRNEDPDIRCEAARAAGYFGNPAAIEPLSRLADDEDEEIRRVAIEAVGRIGGNQAVDALRYLQTQVDDDLKEPISQALDEAEFLAESTGMER